MVSADDEVCQVCDGTRELQGDSCPLCGDEEEEPEATTHASSLRIDAPVFQFQPPEKPAASMSLRGDAPAWVPGLRSDAPTFEPGGQPPQDSRASLNKHAAVWKPWATSFEDSAAYAEEEAYVPEMNDWPMEIHDESWITPVSTNWIQDTKVGGYDNSGVWIPPAPSAKLTDKPLPENIEKEFKAKAKKVIETKRLQEAVKKVAPKREEPEMAEEQNVIQAWEQQEQWTMEKKLDMQRLPDDMCWDTAKTGVCPRGGGFSMGGTCNWCDAQVRKSRAEHTTQHANTFTGSLGANYEDDQGARDEYWNHAPAGPPARDIQTRMQGPNAIPAANQRRAVGKGKNPNTMGDNKRGKGGQKDEVQLQQGRDVRPEKQQVPATTKAPPGFTPLPESKHAPTTPERTFAKEPPGFTKPSPPSSAKISPPKARSSQQTRAPTDSVASVTDEPKARTNGKQDVEPLMKPGKASAEGASLPKRPRPPKSSPSKADNHVANDVGAAKKLAEILPVKKLVDMNKLSEGEWPALGK